MGALQRLSDLTRPESLPASLVKFGGKVECVSPNLVTVSGISQRVSLGQVLRLSSHCLGEVVRVIAPNRFHTLFVGRLLDAYPDAELVVPEESGGLAERFPARTRVLTAPIDHGLALYPVRLRDGLVEQVHHRDRLGARRPAGVEPRRAEVVEHRPGPGQTLDEVLLVEPRFAEELWTSINYQYIHSWTIIQ